MRKHCGLMVGWGLVVVCAGMAAGQAVPKSIFDDDRNLSPGGNAQTPEQSGGSQGNSRPGGASRAEREAVPDAGAVAGAMKGIEATYAGDLKELAKPQDWVFLSEKLQVLAGEETDGAKAYAMLSKAEELAIHGGSFAQVVSVIDSMDDRFEVDGVALKWEGAQATAKTAGADQREELAAGVTKLANDAMARDEYEVARAAAQWCVDNSRGDAQAAALLKAVGQTEEAYKGIQGALAKLANDPNDGDANLAVGKFKCFYKGDWNQGLGMLALGSDAVLKELARGELSGMMGAKAKVKLADGWWERATGASGVAKDKIQLHAAALYAQASAGLVGADKTRADGRVQEAISFHGEMTGASVPAAAGIAAGGTGRALGPTTGAQVAVSGRLAIPSAAAQQEAAELINELYSQQIARATSPELKAVLAKEMMGVAQETKDDAVGKYVLLMRARDLAIKSGDAPTAFACLDELAKGYQVDYLAMKLDLFSELAKYLTVTEDEEAFVDGLNEWMEEQVFADRYGVAERAGDLAMTVAERTQDTGLIRETAAHVKWIKQLGAAYEEVKDSLVKLRSSPEDPGANEAVGRFYCFIKGDWNRGLAMLAMGNDASVAALARQELSCEDDVESKVAVADVWWALGAKESGAAQEGIYRHAGDWYSDVMPHLPPGLVKEKVDKRLVELEKMYPSNGLGVMLERTTAYQWTNDSKEEVKMNPANEGISYLTEIAGFLGGAEISGGLTVDKNDDWALEGRAGGPLSFKAAFLPGPKWEHREFKWKQGQKALRIMNKDTGICCLSWVKGNFQGGGEGVGVELKDDGYWYLRGNSQQSGVSARALAYVIPSSCRYELEAFHWGQGQPPVQMIPKDRGFCYLTGISGHFVGFGEIVKVYVGQDGFWYLGGQSGQEGIAASAIAVEVMPE